LRLSGPNDNATLPLRLQDRIDIHMEVPAIEYKELSSDSVGEPSGKIRERVGKAEIFSYGASKTPEFTATPIWPPASLKPTAIWTSLHKRSWLCYGQAGIERPRA